MKLFPGKSYQEMIELCVSGEGRRYFSRSHGELASYEEHKLPPGPKLRLGQRFAYLGRLYFQGSEEGPEVPAWGRFTDFAYDCLSIFRDSEVTEIYLGNAHGKRLLELLQSVGIPSLRAFWSILYCYNRELSACSLHDGLATLSEGWTLDQRAYLLSQTNPPSITDLEPIRAATTALKEKVEEVDQIATVSPVAAGLALVELREFLDRVIIEVDREMVQRFGVHTKPVAHRPVKAVDGDDRAWLWAYWRRNATGFSDLNRLGEYLGLPDSKNRARAVSKRLHQLFSELKAQGEISPSYYFTSDLVLIDVFGSHWAALETFLAEPADQNLRSD